MAYFTKEEAKNYAQRTKASTESYSSKLESIIESQNYQQHFDIFLSHSIRDKDLVLGVYGILQEMKHTVYIDWISDQNLSRNSVTKETANTLRTRMKQSSRLLYLSTDNASSSKWMPWELEYFDGLKSGRVAILPLLNSAYDSFKGQEYLGVYPALDKSELKKFIS